MYLGSEKPKRRDSPWRVLVLVVLIIGGLYVIREQFSGASWVRPFDPTPAPTRSPESFFDEADLLYDEGLLDEAIAAYEQAYVADPEDNTALYRLVRLMVLRGREGEALERFGARLQDKDLADARTLAVLCMALDWHALFNSEDMMPVYLDLGILDEQEVQDEDWFYSRESVAGDVVRAAQRACEQALRIDTDLPEAHAYLAEALADRERYEEAEKAARTAIDLNPNLPDTQRALAFVYEAQGEYEQAVEAYEAAIAAHPRLGFLHVSLGSNYRAIGFRLQLEDRWDEATPFFEASVAAFEEAIAISPDDVGSYDEIGWTYGHYMGDEREVKQRGVDYLEEALRKDPQYAPAYRHLGQVYYDLRYYEEAIPAFEKAIEIGDLSPTDAVWSHILLGWSYYVLDNSDEDVEDPCTRALAQFKAAWDILEELPRRELGLEFQATQGLEACE
jgi:tetratricopeptide (TPR) repeat protein